MSIREAFGNLFKPEDERRRERSIERRVKIQQAMGDIRRQISQNEKFRLQFLQTARRALQVGMKDQYEFLKASILRTINTKTQLERQLVTLETALIIKEQAESAGNFASAMNAISQSIMDAFGVSDMAHSQANFQKAMARAQTVEEQMNVFLEMSRDTMGNVASDPSVGGASMDDIDRMVRADAAREESSGPDADQLARDIAQLEEAVRKANK